MDSNQPVVTRYTTFDLLILAGCYLTLLERPGERAKAAQLGVRVIVGGTLVLVIILGTRTGIAQAAGWHQVLSQGADVTVNIDKAPDSLVEGALSPGASADIGFIRRSAQIAKTHHLSLFATSDVGRYTKAGLLEPAPVTTVVAPLKGAALKGTETLNARASSTSGIVNVTKVEFHATGGDLKNVLIGTARDTYLGWIDVWDTTAVPDGSYSLQSVAYNDIGRATYSAGVPITVKNIPG